LIAYGIVLLIGLGFFGAALAGGGPEPLKRQSILKLNLNYPIPEQSQSGIPSVINPLSMNFQPSTGLDAIRAGLRAAAEDDKIEGVLLDLGINPNGQAVLSTLHGLLEEFKESGKFVWAYGQFGGQRAYHLATVADSIFLHPTGGIELKGYSAETTFLTEGLDRLGVEVQVFYDGKFKSATEPFRRTDMSPENRLQVRSFIGELWDNYKQHVATNRALTADTVQAIADRLDALQPLLALRHGLVDELAYQDQVYDRLRQKVGLEPDEDLPMVSMQRYLSQKGLPKGNKPQRSGNVAVLYAEGNIIDGEGDEGQIGGASMARLLREARTDEDVDAVVLRVSSPGGSAPASDVIWREAMRLAEEKTLVVSMGNYAASGGYFIAAPGDWIMAEPGTLTGSIGVFLLLPNMRELREEHLGLYADTVNTGAHAHFPSLNRPVDDAQRRILQAMVDSTYVDFKRKVSMGRDMDMEAVEEVAQGRVWTGRQALERGLVDELGGLDEAIAVAAERARLGEDYGILHFPEYEPSPLEEILVGLSEETRMQVEVPGLLGLAEAAEFYGATAAWNEWSGIWGTLQERPVVQARMPYVLEY
jgi:protease-4